MRVEWHGQSAFTLTGSEAKVFIDPFGDMGPLLADRGLKFEHPPIEVDGVDLLLVTHEHRNHNAVEVIPGEPETLRATAGKHGTEAVGEVLGVASEHDEVAGTERGPNTIFVFELDGVRVAHFGDFGQRALRDEQADAIGEVDLVFLPVGGSATIDAEQAAGIVERLAPRWIVPMHYRTHRVDFLDPPDAFLERMANVVRLDQPVFDTAELSGDEPLTIVPAAP